VVAALVLSDGEAQLGLKTRSSDMLWDRDSGPVARLRYCAGEREETLRLHASSDLSARFALGVFRVGEGSQAAPPPPEEPAQPAAPESPSLAAQLARLVASGPRLVPMAPAR